MPEEENLSSSYVELMNSNVTFYQVVFRWNDSSSGYSEGVFRWNNSSSGYSEGVREDKVTPEGREEWACCHKKYHSCYLKCCWRDDTFIS